MRRKKFGRNNCAQTEISRPADKKMFARIAGNNPGTTRLRQMTF